MRFITCLFIFVSLTCSSIFALEAIDKSAQIQPSYDSIPITPETWQQVKLEYVDIINGKEYSAEVNLLRPIKWLKQQGMDKEENEVNLSIPEFGVVDVKAKVIAIRPTKLNTSNIDWTKKKSRPVIGTFKRYATDVRTYQFKDTQGNLEKITATPNHRFYVGNRTIKNEFGKDDHFIDIGDVRFDDDLVNQSGKRVSLVCPKGKQVGCGERYNKSGEVVAVYNLEVYHQHVYYVGDKVTVLVHNGGCLTKGSFSGTLNDLNNFNLSDVGAEDAAEMLKPYGNLVTSSTREAVSMKDSSYSKNYIKSIFSRYDQLSMMDDSNPDKVRELVINIGYGNCNHLSICIYSVLKNSGFKGDFSIVKVEPGHFVNRISDDTGSFLLDAWSGKVFDANNPVGLKGFRGVTNKYAELVPFTKWHNIYPNDETRM
jgi:hypothetical protein